MCNWTGGAGLAYLVDEVGQPVQPGYGMRRAVDRSDGGQHLAHVGEGGPAGLDDGGQGGEGVGGPLLERRGCRPGPA